MTGTTYNVAPIPPDPAHTRWVDAGALKIGVEYRLLDDAELAANYDGADMDEIQEHLDGAPVEDNGVSIHVAAAEGGHEYLRFDCFDNEPHYHYITPARGSASAENTIIDFDRVAHGEMVPWTFQQLRTRIREMLARAGGDDVAAAIDPESLAGAFAEVERLAREAETALNAQKEKP